MRLSHAARGVWPRRPPRPAGLVPRLAADELRFADGTAFSAANSFTIAAPDETGASDASAGISIDAESMTIGSDSWQPSTPWARVSPVA
jgi:hypothetical protein